MSELLTDLTDKVLTITMNQPKKLNALTPQMSLDAAQELREAALDPKVGCIVVTGAGRAFCAGGDVSAMAAEEAPTYEEAIEDQRRRHDFPLLLHTIPKPTIAAVNGHAMGAGLGISLSCDLRLASEAGKFGTAFANVGFGGDFGTTWQLTRLVGEAKAKELFFLTDIIDAQEAHRLGLVNRVYAADSFMDEVMTVASRLAHGPSVSYRWMKENINQSSLTDFKTMLDREAVTHLRCGQTADHKEGVAAFMEKRTPTFVGR